MSAILTLLSIIVGVFIVILLIKAIASLFSFIVIAALIAIFVWLLLSLKRVV